MRLLWLSDSPRTRSAYGGQAALILPRLRALGHEVALCPVGERTGSIYELDGMPVLPCVNDPYHRDVISDHCRYFGAKAVISLCDPHVLDGAMWNTPRWVSWTPIDCDPIREDTRLALARASEIWAVSRHTVKMLKDVDKESTYVPHGIDTKVFCPGDRRLARERLSKRVGVDLKNAFLVVTVAANASSPSRKGFFELFSAFRVFAEKCAEAHLYVHTSASGGGRGEDLREVAALAGCPSGRLHFPPEYDYSIGLYGPENLADTYRAADVLVSASHGEGFGLPLYEAQACGVPVIVPRNTSQTEAVSQRLVDCVPYYPCKGASLWYRPDVLGLAEAMVQAKYHRESDALLAERVEKMREFDIDRVFVDHFKPALDQFIGNI